MCLSVGVEDAGGDAATIGDGVAVGAGPRADVGEVEAGQAGGGQASAGAAGLAELGGRLAGLALVTPGELGGVLEEDAVGEQLGAFAGGARGGDVGGEFLDGAGAGLVAVGGWPLLAVGGDGQGAGDQLQPVHSSEPWDSAT